MNKKTLFKTLVTRVINSPMYFHLNLFIGSCRSDTDMDHPSDLRCQERLPMQIDSQDTETGYYIYGWQIFRLNNRFIY